MRVVAFALALVALLSRAPAAAREEPESFPSALLICRSDPPGATILVGHPHSQHAYRKGVTPKTVEITAVAPVPRELRVTFVLEGYEPWSEIIAVKSGERVVLDVKLQPKRTMVFVGSQALLAADARGKNVRRLFALSPPCDPSAPSWNPEGTAFVLVSGGEVCRATLASRAPERIVTAERVARAVGAEHVVCRAPAWSKDGRWVAFLAAADGAASLLVVPSEGGEPHVLARYVTSPPAWSKTGLLAASGPAGLVIWDMSKGEPRQLSTLRGASDPCWSPEGERLVFCMSGELFVADARLQAIAQLTNSGRAGPRRPQWSPDGKTIVCVIRRELPGVDPWDELWAVFPDSARPPARLASGEQGFGERRFIEPGGFTPDGQSFCFTTTGSGEILTVGLDGAGPRLLVYAFGFPSWSGPLAP